MQKAWNQINSLLKIYYTNLNYLFKIFLFTNSDKNILFVKVDFFFFQTDFNLIFEMQLTWISQR